MGSTVRMLCLIALFKIELSVAYRDNAFVGYSEQTGSNTGNTAESIFLKTTFGKILIKLRTDISPKVVELVSALARANACKNCQFYRHEPVPQGWGLNGFVGPPYALLQGSLASLQETPPFEGNPIVKKGDVCIIPRSKEFFIATADHDEWGTSHTVWGKVEDEDSWATISSIPVEPFFTRTDSYNITTRWLKDEAFIPFELVYVPAAVAAS